MLNLEELRTSSEVILRNHPKLHALNVFRAEKAVLEEVIRRKRELGRGHLKVFAKSLPVDGEVLEAFDQIFDKWGVHLGHFTVKGVEFYSKHEQRVQGRLLRFWRI